MLLLAAIEIPHPARIALETTLSGFSQHRLKPLHAANPQLLSKRRRPMSSEQFGPSVGFGDTMREREFQVFRKQLLDVGTLDIVGLLDLNDFEDLYRQSISTAVINAFS